jgi:hypothetical protein
MSPVKTFNNTTDKWGGISGCINYEYQEYYNNILKTTVVSKGLPADWK